MFLEILIISIFAGLVSIDIRTIGGTMISRPLVVSPLIGFFLGDLKIGFLIATFLELIWIGLLPVGAYLPVETLPIAVVATSLSIIFSGKISENVPGIIVFCMIIAIPLGFIGRWLEYHIRTFNSYLSSKVVLKAEKGDITMVSYVQYLNILISFIKGFLLCFIPVFFGKGILMNIYQSLPNQIKQGIFFSSWLVLALGFAVVIEIFILNKYIRYFFISFIAFALLLIVI